MYLLALWKKHGASGEMKGFCSSVGNTAVAQSGVGVKIHTRSFRIDRGSGTASLECNEVQASLNLPSLGLWWSSQTMGDLCPMSSPGLCLTDITSAIVVGSS